jgi:hypothetical protein
MSGGPNGHLPAHHLGDEGQCPQVDKDVWAFADARRGLDDDKHLVQERRLQPELQMAIGLLR